MPPSGPVAPLTPDRWGDLERLFGPNGAYSNCWCMWWRMTGAAFDRAGNTGRHELFGDLVQEGPPPGLLAYDDAGTPVGWVAMDRREAYGRLQRSPKLGPVDDQPAWAITCFFVGRGHRGQGVAARLLDAAVELAATRGGGIVEGYPIDTDDGRRADASVFTGTVELFTAAGFTEVARRGGRPIMRRSAL